MTNADFSFHPKILQFVAPFGISKLTRSEQGVLRVCIEKNGLQGWGETSPISYYSHSLENFVTTASLIQKTLNATEWEHPKDLYLQLEKLIADNTFIRSAIDGAAWDWYGKQLKKPVWEILNLKNPKTGRPTNFTIGLSTPENMLADIQKNPWSTYKIKLGNPHDLDILNLLLSQTTAPFRIDANAGWDISSAKRVFDLLDAKDWADRIEMIEEPFQNIEDLKRWKTLDHSVKIPFFADESMQGIEDLEKLALHYQGVNVKFDKCGGLSKALPLIQKAKSLGLLIQLGCMSGSAITLAAPIQVASLGDVIDLDAGMLVLEDDFGLEYHNEIPVMTGNWGCGIVK